MHYLLLITYCIYLVRLSGKGMTFIFLINIIMFIQLIGLSFFTLLVSSNSFINLVIFILTINFSYFYALNTKVLSKKRTIVFSNLINLKFTGFVLIMVLSIFFLTIGNIFQIKGDALEGRKHIISFGNGLFARIILVIFPIISAVFITQFLLYKKKQLLIVPFFSLVFVFLLGYRGFVVWIVIFYLMVINYFRLIRVNNWKLLTMAIGVLTILTLITNSYYSSLNFESSFLMLFDRIFFDSIYGYYYLVEHYNVVGYIGLWDLKTLGNDLFISNFGSEGRIAKLGGELTFTLAGASYALGGYFGTIFISMIVGLVSGKLHSKNLISGNSQVVFLVFRTFLLYSIIGLIVRGYIINYFQITLVSVIIAFSIFLLFQKSVYIKRYE